MVSENCPLVWSGKILEDYGAGCVTMFFTALVIDSFGKSAENTFRKIISLIPYLVLVISSILCYKVMYSTI